MKKKEQASAPGEGLMQDDRINAILQQRKNISEDEADSKIIKEYCIIETGGYCFGIQIEYLREVFDLKERADIIPIPFTPDFILGIINVRGEILPVASLGELLGFKRDEAAAKIIVTDVHLKVAFPAAGILDLVQVNIADVRPIRETGSSGGIRFVNGEFDYAAKTVFVIDMIRLFASENFRDKT